MKPGSNRAPDSALDVLREFAGGGRRYAMEADRLAFQSILDELTAHRHILWLEERASVRTVKR